MYRVRETAIYSRPHVQCACISGLTSDFENAIGSTEQLYSSALPGPRDLESLGYTQPPSVILPNRISQRLKIIF